MNSSLALGEVALKFACPGQVLVYPFDELVFRQLSWSLSWFLGKWEWKVTYLEICLSGTMVATLFWALLKVQTAHRCGEFSHFWITIICLAENLNTYCQTSSFDCFNQFLIIMRITLLQKIYLRNLHYNAVNWWKSLSSVVCTSLLEKLKVGWLWCTDLVTIKVAAQLQSAWNYLTPS